MATYRNQNFKGLYFTQACQSGGALKLPDGFNIIENCTFDDNGGTNFSTYGGAVSMQTADQTVTISNSCCS